MFLACRERCVTPYRLRSLPVARTGDKGIRCAWKPAVEQKFHGRDMATLKRQCLRADTPTGPTSFRGLPAERSTPPMPERHSGRAWLEEGVRFTYAGCATGGFEWVGCGARRNPFRHVPGSDRSEAAAGAMSMFRCADGSDAGQGNRRPSRRYRMHTARLHRVEKSGVFAWPWASRHGLLIVRGAAGGGGGGGGAFRIEGLTIFGTGGGEGGGGGTPTRVEYKQEVWQAGGGNGGAGGGGGGLDKGKPVAGAHGTGCQHGNGGDGGNAGETILSGDRLASDGGPAAAKVSREKRSLSSVTTCLSAIVSRSA